MKNACRWVEPSLQRHYSKLQRASDLTAKTGLRSIYVCASFLSLYLQVQLPGSCHLQQPPKEISAAVTTSRETMLTESFEIKTDAEGSGQLRTKRFNLMAETLPSNTSLQRASAQLTKASEANAAIFHSAPLHWSLNSLHVRRKNLATIDVSQMLRSMYH